MDAILDAEALEYKLPSTTKELDEATQGFELSSHGAIKGVLNVSMSIYYRLNYLQEVRQAM